MTHLKVAVRVRPLSRREVERNSTKILDVENGKTIAITNIKVPEQNAGDSRERIRRFTFDFCFHENFTQDEVFEAVENVIGKAIRRRYHSCVLAYGQSSSGKTHTMMGFPHDPGLTPRLCEKVFSYLEETAVGDEMTNANITVSYLEIYNEKVRDLLYKRDGSIETHLQLPTLKIRQHPKKGPYVQGLTEISVTNSDSLLELLHVGNNNRKVAATLTNLQSSRSHSVFIITFSGVKLTLVDLAGSERAGNRCYSTSRFREGANINKSLVALGNVISALAEETSKFSKGIRRRFIPYRDSVLTWLLKDTLGGNSHTFMIATISPSSTCYSETVNTLRFGQRAKLIVSTPVVNEDPREKTIRELRVEIARLRELLNFKTVEIVNISEETTKENTPMSHEVSDSVSEAASTNTLNSLSDSREILQENACTQGISKTKQESIEKLIPVMNFTNSHVSEAKKPSPVKLRRTFSVEHPYKKMEEGIYKKFGSEEAIPTTNQSGKPPLPSSQVLSRKGSLSKTNSSSKLVQKKPPELKKREKSISDPKSFTNVEARVGSIRKAPPKPRSQIVAAVTNRLYAKTKKKDVATDTSDMPRGIELPKELMICSNARLKLKELTKKALKAHRNRNEETQTDLFPIMRVKEACTDAHDLKAELQEIKSVETATQSVETQEIGVNCSFLDTLGEEFAQHLRNTFVVTRSCGTQSVEKSSPTKEPQTSVSFTKYLNNPGKIEIFNPNTANPIYTNSVNINISHNYINGRRLSASVSDDSLEEQNNVCFATPDLISNHNSLEPHAHATTSSAVKDPLASKTRHADSVVSDQNNFETTCDLILNDSKCCVANCRVVPQCCEELTSINIPSVCAPQVCVVKDELNSRCQHFIPISPQAAKPNIIEYKTYSDDCITLIEPLVLKSIMKHIPNDNKKSNNSDDDYEEEELQITDTELPDSLEYHLANSKKVRFSHGRKAQNERMLKAMSEFLEEAARLMNNLTSVTNKLDNSNPIENDYEIQVLVNEISGLEQLKAKRKKIIEKQDSRSQTENHVTKTNEYVQTFPTITVNSSSQYSDFDMPVNKYEMLLEDSCRRLEEKINAISARSSRESLKDSSYKVRQDFDQPLSYSHWDLNPLENEDLSIDSNAMTFSDYGSLPRRKSKRSSNSCSPSAFLRQLATIRKQVVETSRDEIFNNN